MTTLSERNEIKAEVLEEVADLFNTIVKVYGGVGITSVELSRSIWIDATERAQSLRQSRPPTAEGKVELYRQVLRNTDSYVRSTVSYERDTAAEAVIEAARGVLDGDSEGAINLQDALSSFDSSRGVNNG
jgi:hypothetical protein